MSNDDPATTLDELLDGRTIVMLMTMIGNDHPSRPLTDDPGAHRAVATS